MRILNWIRDVIAWLKDPFVDYDDIDVPIGLEDIHELSGGKLEEPR